MPTLSPTATALRTARDDARALCRENDVETGRGDDFVLVVSELVSNAMLHGAPPSAYDIRLVDGDLLVTVDDAQPQGPPPPLPRVDGAEGGRGLALVEALARLWGWLPIVGGKRVWARV